MYNEQIGKLIVARAANYIGYEEIPENQGFKDHLFDSAMRSIGFQNGWAWCSLLTKLIWMEAYTQANLSLINSITHLISPSALGTLHNFQAQEQFEVSTIPQIGAIVIWQHGHTVQGHAGIVEGIETKAGHTILHTIEGNTNDKGGREGYIVARKQRPLEFTSLDNKLNLKGFIYPA